MLGSYEELISLLKSRYEKATWLQHKRIKVVFKFIDEEKVKFVHFHIDQLASHSTTPSEWTMQLLVPQLKNGVVKRHLHSHAANSKIEKNNAEVWICCSGSCSFEVYSMERELVYSAGLKPWEVLLVELGGNSITQSSPNFKFLEIKNGPFTGQNWEYF